MSFMQGVVMVVRVGGCCRLGHLEALVRGVFNSYAENTQFRYLCDFVEGDEFTSSSEIMSIVNQHCNSKFLKVVMFVQYMALRCSLVLI